MGSVASISLFSACTRFAIVYRNHVDLFDGEVVPEKFVNQDGGDPFLCWSLSSLGVLDDGSSPGFLILLLAVVRRAVNRGWTFEELSNAAEIADSDG